MATAIEFDHVGKQYRLGNVSMGTLGSDLHRWWTVNILRKEDPYLKIGDTNDRSTKGSSDYVWALRDINFKVEQGDVVGIIGRNGAGKSTLLKLLSKVTGPTVGQIRARGRIGSLLEVGTGFHPEMTGRENIYMNGAILGMTKAEISRKLDEIVDFSGCERYLDTPVKRYSSGMMVRLGFAVAAHLDPEILVVDEVLAVGDAEFQKKAIGKMKDVSQGEGRTVLFVSHNMESVKMLCNRGILLNNGQIEMMGTAEECVDHYLNVSNRMDIVSRRDDVSSCREHNFFRSDVEFVSVMMLNEHPDAIATDEPLRFRVRLKATHNAPVFQLCLFFLNASGIRVLFCQTEELEVPEDRDEFDVEVEIPNHSLPRGRYNVRFETNLQHFDTGSVHFDFLLDALSFNVRYVHKDKKDEYLYWESEWGHILQLGDNNIVAKMV